VYKIYNAENTKLIYVKGDLLVKKIEDEDFFDHVIVLGSYRGHIENVYEFYTSDGNIEARTAAWVNSNYEKPSN
jgi:hypothetical protein